MSWLALTLVVFGCFVAVFYIKNRQMNHPALQFPYRLKASPLSADELALYELLDKAVGERYRILVKVRAADVVDVTAVPRRAPWYHAVNRIGAGHFDFLLCRKDDLGVVCAIEYTASPAEQEPFIEQLCQSIGLPLVRLSAERARSFSEVQSALESVLPG